MKDSFSGQSGTESPDDTDGQHDAQTRVADQESDTAVGAADTELTAMGSADTALTDVGGGDTQLTDVGDTTQMTSIGTGASGLAPGRRERVIKERFVLEQALGKGGMGEVFRALDLRKQEAQDDNPHIAIKFLGKQFSRHPRALISLQREAKKSQQLAHPNILTVYDFDRDGDHVYMTMELLDGAPLSRWESLELEGDRTDVVASLIEQMASGLAYAHEQGLVHSDFKPDNVFVTREGRVKILDFGIARIMDSAVQQDSFDAGELGALTVPYASLEMLRGDSQPHPADDVYALGLVAYMLYTGRHPFDGKSAQEAHDAQLVPEPIPGIKRREWKAIAHALKLERDARTAGGEQFLREFTGGGATRKALVAAVLVLALSSAFFAWQASQREGPAVPFDELPVAQQTQITDALERGDKSVAIGDWDGASRYFMQAYELHPRNPDAEAGLDQVAEHLLSLGRSMTDPRAQKRLLSIVDAYGENEYLANHKLLKTLRSELGAAGAAEGS